MKEKTNKSKSLRVIVFICRISIAFLIVAMLIQVFNMVKDYGEISITDKMLVGDVIKTTEQPKDTPQSIKNEEFSVDWEKLNRINKDVVAWIEIPNTAVSYPVVQGDNNQQYVHTNIYGSYSKGGTLFIDARTANPFIDANTIIYGHNLMNGAMFSSLRKYGNQTYLKNNEFIYVYLPDNQILKYKVVSFHIVLATDVTLYNPQVSTVADYTSEIFKNSNSQKINLDNSQSVITLSTCTNNNENTRYVVHAVVEN